MGLQILGSGVQIAFGARYFFLNFVFFPRHMVFCLYLPTCLDSVGGVEIFRRQILFFIAIRHYLGPSSAPQMHDVPKLQGTLIEAGRVGSTQFSFATARVTRLSSSVYSSVESDMVFSMVFF